jgi:RNA polymerase sigma-70 factor (ECF subfamily)
MLLQHSRRDARLDPEGGIVLLADQDRARWDRAAIAEALPLVDAALTARRPAGPYALQAAIAALHAGAPSAAATDWRQIAVLYRELLRTRPSPVVALNRAVAVAEAEGAAAGLALLAQIGGALDGYHLFHAARADLLRREGRRGEAAAAYRRALELARTEPERAFLTRRLAELGPPA